MTSARRADVEHLLALLEASAGGSRTLDWEIVSYLAAGWAPDHPPAYTTSLDAALTLVPPGFQWAINAPNIEGELQFRAEVNWSHSTWAASAPLALCIAALKARAGTPKSVPSVEQTPDRSASPQESKDFPP